jgi:hypothetical protein
LSTVKRQEEETGKKRQGRRQQQEEVPQEEKRCFIRIHVGSGDQEKGKTLKTMV